MKQKRNNKPFRKEECILQRIYSSFYTLNFKDLQYTKILQVLYILFTQNYLVHTGFCSKFVFRANCFNGNG